MRTPRTLFAYVTREVLTYTALGLAAISVVMVTQNLFRYLEELLAVGVGAVEVLSVAGHLALMLATYTVPIAFLAGVLLAYGRIASDAEVLAMHSCGVGLGALLLPAIALGALASAATGLLVLDVEHEAQLALRRTVKALTVRGGFVEAGHFRRLDERVLFVRGVDANDQLRGVLIEDRSDPSRPLMIFAERGELAWDEDDGRLLFRLRDGDIHVDPSGEDDGYERIAFGSFDFALDAEGLFGRRFATLRPREMTLEQLRDVVARARAGDGLEDLRRSDPMHYELQIQRRLALPFAPLLFGLVGAPLGLERRRGARSWGMLSCVALVFGYYAILTFSEFLAFERLLGATAASWLPNAVFAVAAIPLIARARRVPG